MQDTIIGMRVLTQYECLSTKINSREEARNGTRALNRNHYGIQRIKSLSLLYIYIYPGILSNLNVVICRS